MPKRTFILLIVVLSLLMPSSLFAWEGKVVGVTDGDTIKAIKDEKQVNIRLYGIDTPEKKQAFGKVAKEFTASQVAGRVVDVEEITIDRYGRVVAIITSEGKCLNEELIRNGMAWLYKRYCDMPICASWFELEQEARTKKLGLWKEPSPIPPWEWRRKK